MLDLGKIKIFYDGMDIDKYTANRFVQGFTTNCTFFSKYPIRNYKELYYNVKNGVNGRPLSFQIWEDEYEKAVKQIDSILALDKDLYIKVPIIKTNGILNKDIFDYIKNKKIKVNITSIHTIEQINKAYEMFKDYDVPFIVSIFVGPVSDVGNDPRAFIEYSVEAFGQNKNAEILWAGCREVYSIYRAIESGCHIITCPDSVIDKLETLGKSLDLLTIERVQTFRKDAIESNLSID